MCNSLSFFGLLWVTGKRLGHVGGLCLEIELYAGPLPILMSSTGASLGFSKLQGALATPTLSASCLDAVELSPYPGAQVVSLSRGLFDIDKLTTGFGLACLSQSLFSIKLASFRSSFALRAERGFP